MQTRKGAGNRGQKVELMRTLFLTLIALASFTLSRPADSQTLTQPSARQEAFTIEIRDGLISLDAKEASLKGIFDEIGRRMDIPVAVQIPAAAKASLAFTQLPLPEALKRFGNYVNYAYVQRWEGGESHISSVTVHSLKVSSPAAQAGTDASREMRPGKALEIEINPRQFLQPKRP